MTESISVANTENEGKFTEKMLRGMVGYILFLTVQLASIFGLFLTTEATNRMRDFSLMRFIALAAAALTFFILYRFIKSRDSLVRSKTGKMLFSLGEIILPAIVLLEHFTAIVVPFPAIVGCWILWGICHALLTCSWVDAKSNLEESSATAIAFWSFAITACLLVGLFAMSNVIGAGGILVMAMLSGTLLVMAPPHPGSAMTAHDEEWLASNSIFKKTGSYIMIVDGIMVAFAAGVLIHAIGRHAMPSFLLGVAFLGTAGLFLFLKTTRAELLSLERSQLVFLPLFVGCFAIIGYGQTGYSIVAAFILFAALYLIDFSNRSRLSLRGNLLSISPTYCYSKGRMYIVLGEAIGWLTIRTVSDPAGMAYLPVAVVVILILMCVYVAMGALHPVKYPLVFGMTEEEEDALKPAAEPVQAIVSEEHPYKNRCLRVSQKYDLTPREGEILAYLARGRNAKYIADQLFVAERTVKTHTYHIYQKMGIHSQQELINIVEDQAASDASGA